jgi:hypothetical protein
MKPINDIDKLIVKALNNNEEKEIELLAYQTGSTVSNVMQAATKLQTLNIIEINDAKLKLIPQGGKPFNNWDSLKKK